MPRSYARDTFFNVFHFFEDAEGKKQRDALVERFSFFTAFNAGDLSNAEKRDAQPWDDSYFVRANTVDTIRDNFGAVVEAVHFTADRETKDQFAPLRDAIEDGHFFLKYDADSFAPKAPIVDPQKS